MSILILRIIFLNVIFDTQRWTFQLSWLSLFKCLQNYYKQIWYIWPIDHSVTKLLPLAKTWSSWLRPLMFFTGLFETLEFIPISRVFFVDRARGPMQVEKKKVKTKDDTSHRERSVQVTDIQHCLPLTPLAKSLIWYKLPHFWDNFRLL